MYCQCWREYSGDSGRKGGKEVVHFLAAVPTDRTSLYVPNRDKVFIRCYIKCYYTSVAMQSAENLQLSLSTPYVYYVVL